MPPVPLSWKGARETVRKIGRSGWSGTSKVTWLGSGLGVGVGVGVGLGLVAATSSAALATRPKESLCTSPHGWPASAWPARGGSLAT